jgi:hypothetical protein
LEIIKQSRFSKIIGDFGEHAVCNWLSRSGFEVVLIDHTGIDVVAYRPKTGERLGITVKARTRVAGVENDSVNLFSYQRGKNDRQRVLDACKAFACTPWLAVYVEKIEHADLYLTSLDNYDAKYSRKGQKVDDWSMSSKSCALYASDEAVQHLRIDFKAHNWW